MKRYKMDEVNVRICGKTIETARGIRLMHSGTFVEFHGKLSKISIEVVGTTEKDAENYDAYLGVFINESITPEKILRVKNGIYSYDVCERKEKEELTVKIVKLTELQYGGVEVVAVFADGEIAPTKSRERKLLFIGDSITAGYGVNGENSDPVFTTETENVTMAYPYMTADRVSADAWFVCWSGGGVISRWIPPAQDKALTDILLPGLFEKGIEKYFCPDMILVNLGTNDASYTRGDLKKEETFANNYVRFILNISTVYPDAGILIQYGLMETSLTPTIKRVVERCKHHNIRCSFLELPVMNMEDGLGTNGHPSLLTHKKMTRLLEDKIRNIMGWEDERGFYGILSE